MKRRRLYLVRATETYRGKRGPINFLVRAPAVVVARYNALRVLEEWWGSEGESNENQTAFKFRDSDGAERVVKLESVTPITPQDALKFFTKGKT